MIFVGCPCFLFTAKKSKGVNTLDNVLSNHVPMNEDTYRIFVPIEDDELLKAVTMDDNGDYIVQGVMTSDAKDEQDDIISPEGMDCSYFLEKGWIKYEHGSNPDQFIGEPIAVQVGRFIHPTTKKAVNGIFVKGRLFAQRKLTQKAVEAITEIQKSNTSRRMGWSIEGNTKERNEAGKIVKSVLRNVVLTMNPINTTTWAELAKSFATDHEVTISLDEPIDKALDVAATQEIRQQSIEGVRDQYRAKRRGSQRTADAQQKWVNAFRKFVKFGMRKSHRNLLVKSAEFAGDSAYFFVKDLGFEDEDAEGFANYIQDKHTILKALGNYLGGASMGKEVQNALANILDEDLEELQKSLELDSEEQAELDFEDDEDLEKGFGDDEDDEDEEKGDGDKDEEDEEDEVEKSFSSENSFTKSFTEVPENAEALEVSDFLANLVDEVGMHMNGFEKSMQAQRKQSTTLIKAVHSMGELMKSLANELAEVRADNEELKKSLEDTLSRPVGRRSVVTSREANTLEKSMQSQAKQSIGTHAEIGEILFKAFEAGEIQGSEIARFEAGVPLDKLALTSGLRKSFGLV